MVIEKMVARAEILERKALVLEDEADLGRRNSFEHRVRACGLRDRAARLRQKARIAETRQTIDQMAKACAQKGVEPDAKIVKSTLTALCGEADDDDVGFFEAQRVRYAGDR